MRTSLHDAIVKKEHTAKTVTPPVADVAEPDDYGTT